MSKHFEVVSKVNSNGGTYRLFIETQYYLVWVKVNYGKNTVKVRVDAKELCSHMWRGNTKNSQKWTIEEHNGEYVKDNHVAPTYYTIKVNISYLADVLGDVIKSIYTEYGSSDFLQDEITKRIEVE